MVDAQTHETAVALLGVAFQSSLARHASVQGGEGGSVAGAAPPTQETTSTTSAEKREPTSRSGSGAPAAAPGPPPNPSAAQPFQSASTASASAAPPTAFAGASLSHLASQQAQPTPPAQYNFNTFAQNQAIAQHNLPQHAPMSGKASAAPIPSPAPPTDKVSSPRPDFEHHLHQLKILQQQELQRRQHEHDLRQHHAQAMAGALQQQQKQQHQMHSSAVSNQQVHLPLHRSDSAPASVPSSLPPARGPVASAHATETKAPTSGPQQDNIVLAMSSIGFGIDSTGSASSGDATEAAMRALQDAMERSTLRLPMSSSTNHALEIQVQLGIPQKHAGSIEPMTLDTNKIASILPTAIPLLPIKVVIGGLFIPPVGLQTPAICTAVACITLQSRSMALISPMSPPPPSVADVSPRRRHSVQIPARKPTPTTSHADQSWAPSTAAVAHQTGSRDRSMAATFASTVTSPARTANRSSSVGSSLGRLPTAASAPSMVVSTSTPSLAVSEALAKLQAAAASASNSQQSAPPTRNSSIASGMSSSSSNENESDGNNDNDGSGNSMDMLATISEEMQKASEPKAQAPASTGSASGSWSSNNDSSKAVAPATAALQQYERNLIQFKNKNQVAGSVLVHSESSNGLHVFATAAEMSSINPNNQEELAAMLRQNSHCNYNYKKLPPGVTTKNNQRLFVKHKYRDHSVELPLSEEQDLMLTVTSTTRTPNAAFPLKLHETLTQIEINGHSDIIGWMPHGRSFKIHKQKEFAEIILPQYFVMTKKSSFLRQLNLYGFNRFSAGADQGSYYHEKFLRGMKFLTRRMARQKVNGNRIRSAGNPDEEPVLAEYPACPPPSLSNRLAQNSMNQSFPGTSLLMSVATIAANQSAMATGSRFGYVSRDEDVMDDKDSSSTIVKRES